MEEDRKRKRAKSSRSEVAVEEVAAQLCSLGVAEGGVLLVHTSFSAVRPVENGPKGLIRALVASLGPQGTLVMPSWTGDDEAPFDPASTEAAADLGVVARTFWRLPRVRRASHPHAFAAFGPQAERILADPLPLPPHIAESPVGRVHELDGQVLLLGVNHDADTTIHLAEVLARVPYGHYNSCTAFVDGKVQRFEYLENDHCCDRFKLVDDWLRQAGRQAEGTVGHAHSRLIRSQDIVSAVVPRLIQYPLLFLHQPSAGCEECDEARRNI